MIKQMIWFFLFTLTPIIYVTGQTPSAFSIRGDLSALKKKLYKIFLCYINNVDKVNDSLAVRKT